MQLTYLFYDIESSGLNKCFDQVLQFAAIRTDLQLNEIERYELKIKPNSDILPAPGAVVTHYLSPESLQDGISELDALEKIHAWMNTPGTISLGYNTLTFDDEFLRFSFYRNLLPPYTHQYANQCKRMDLYPILTFFHLYKPEVLAKWPMIEGQVSLKLENLNEVNQFAKGRAHDAMVDVEATVALARCLTKAKPMWDYLIGYFDKVIDQKRCQDLPVTMESQHVRHHEGLMILGRFGTKNAYQAPVLCLGPHVHYKNQTLWLRLDLPELRNATLDNLDDMTWVMSKKFAEPGFLLPANPERLQKIKAPRLVEVSANKQWIVEHPLIFEGIVDFHRHYKYPVLPNTDIDAALYQQEFLSPYEQKRCEQFHRADSTGKAAWIESCQHPGLRELAIRIMGRHYPEYLSPELREKFQHYLRQVFSDNPQQLPIDFRGTKRMGITQAMTELAQLRQKPGLAADKQSLLTALERYYQRLLTG